MRDAQKNQSGSFVKREVNSQTAHSSSNRQFRSWREQCDRSATPLPDSYLKQRQKSHLPFFLRNRELRLLVAVLSAVAIAYAVFYYLEKSS